MHSTTWTLMALLTAAAPAAGAADVRVAADDSWCREGGGWNGRRARHCEVREASWRAAGPVKADAGRRRGHAGGRIETDLGRGGQLLRLQTTNGGLHVSQE